MYSLDLDGFGIHGVDGLPTNSRRNGLQCGRMAGMSVYAGLSFSGCTSMRVDPLWLLEVFWRIQLPLPSLGYVQFDFTSTWVPFIMTYSRWVTPWAVCVRSFKVKISFVSCFVSFEVYMNPVGRLGI